MKKTKDGQRADRIALYLFVASAAVFMFAYGYAVGSYGIFPRSILKMAKAGFLELKTQSLRFVGLADQPEKSLPWYYVRAKKPYPPPIFNTDRAYRSGHGAREGPAVLRQNHGYGWSHVA
jgi:hypothetical protein